MFTNIISKLSFLGNELSAKWTVDEMIVDETIRTPFECNLICTYNAIVSYNRRMHGSEGGG